MNFQFLLKGTKSTKQIYLRLYKCKFDVSKATGYVIEESDWNDEKQKPKNDVELEIKLSELKTTVLKSYNTEIGKGIIFNGWWLQNTIKTFLKRPKDEIGLVNLNHNLYLSDYAENWLKIGVLTYRFKGKLISEANKKAYSAAIKKLDEFKPKILIKEAGSDLLQSFADYLTENKYSRSTALKIVDRVSFFISRAEKDSLPIDSSYKNEIWIEEEYETDSFYLNEDNINAICGHDFSTDEHLDAIRDLFIINLRCGVRISDLMHTLTTESIKNGFITLKTKKTSTQIVIPVHQNITDILKKRFGNLPPKVSEKEFNKAIKEIGRICGFTEMITRKVFDKKLKRKKMAYLPMYKFFTSHLSRRSLATNLKDKISQEALQQIFGWSTATMSKIYNQKSKKEYAEEARKAFN